MNDTRLMWDVFLLSMSLIAILRTLPELYLAIGDVIYQHTH